MQWLNKAALGLGRFLAWGFLVIALMMLFEVALRYGFGAPTIWAHEIAGLLAAVAFIFGGAYCMAERSHMRISLLADKAPGLLRRLLEGISLVAGVVYLGGLALAMWPISQKALFRFAPDGAWMPERSGTSWDSPLPSFTKLALFLGAVLFLAIILYQLVQLIARRPHSGEQR